MTDWICLTCKQPGAVPRTPLLDGNYGSDRCHSLFCKGERRIFHREEAIRATPDPDHHPDPPDR